MPAGVTLPGAPWSPSRPSTAAGTSDAKRLHHPRPQVFARQLIALARPEDVAVGISTSGSSANIIAALEEGDRRQMLTCAITGYDGGRLRELRWLDHLFIVRGDYIPRLQEAHATIYHLLLEAIGGR